jgi:phosphoribosylglycinamide formyltransferase-1
LTIGGWQIVIGILTYNVPHRKTYDTLCLLKAKGVESKVIVFAESLHYEKTFRPLLQHRPPSTNTLTPKELCESFSYEYHDGFNDKSLPENSKLLICGAGIISNETIEKYRIINAHPGYIPNVRGLDALKWAIYDGHPIGVTTHQLGEHVDAGLIIDRQIVPLYFNDTFHAVAQRQYEMEVNMLVDAIEKIETACEYAEPDNYPLKKRMTHEMETRVIKRFDNIVQKTIIE